MKVLYDYLGLFEPVGGVSRYFAEMIRRLPVDIEPKLAYVETRNKYFAAAPYNIPLCKCSFYNFLSGINFKGKSIAYRTAARLMPWKYPAAELKNEAAFREELERGDFDVLHLTGPHYLGEDWKRVIGRKPIVVTIHDLVPELFHVQPRAVRNRRFVLENAAQVIAVSENTKRDLERLYGVDEGKITVIHHGYSDSREEREERVEGLEPGKFVLFVGKQGGYKNFKWMEAALEPFLQERGMRLFATCGQTDAELRWLYRNALAFVYPSKYEGFGIPILEAFANGCPAVLSNCSCFPEVAGDAALYFGVEDGGAELRRQLARLVDEPGLRGEMIAKGKSRLSEFSWDKCAESTATVYHKAMEMAK